MCDCLCALGPAAGGVTVFAKNSDRPPAEAQVLERHEPRTESSTRATHIAIDGPSRRTIGFVGSRPAWAWGVEHGVNDAGVAAGNETIYTTLDPRQAPAGVIGIDLVRLALERAETAEQGAATIVDLVERYGQGGSGHERGERPYWSSFLVADPSSAFVVETSGREFAVETITGTRAISNRTTIPIFDAAHRHPRQPVATLVDPRWRASKVVLTSEPVTVAALIAHSRSHVGGAEGWTVCMHVEGVEATTAALVAELPSEGPPRARFLLGSPCRSIFVPVLVGPPLGEPPGWHEFAALGDDDRARLDEIEHELEADFANGDDDWNVNIWPRVRGALASP